MLLFDPQRERLLPEHGDRVDPVGIVAVALHVHPQGGQLFLRLLPLALAADHSDQQPQR
jgi:hypothetical protein